MKHFFKAPLPKWMFGVTIATVITICLMLSFRSYQARIALSQGQSFCISAEGCDDSLVNPYTNPLGVPFPFWVFFMEIGILTLFLLGFKKQGLGASAYGLSVFALGALVLIQIVLIVASGKWSPFLLLTTGLCFLQTYSGRGLLSSSPARSKSWIGFLAAVVGASLSAWIFHGIISKSTALAQADLNVQRALGDWNKEAPKIINNETGVLISQSGSGDPVLTIVEYSDLFAANWKTTANTLDGFIQSHPGVHLIWKPFPLDSKCNRFGRPWDHSVHCDLAAALYCSEKLGQKGSLAYHWILKHHEELQNLKDIIPALTGLTSELQLPAAEFQNCLRSNSTLQWLQNVAEEGYRARARTPPSLFVNGKLLMNVNILLTLEDIYQRSK